MMNVIRLSLSLALITGLLMGCNSTPSHSEIDAEVPDAPANWHTPSDAGDVRVDWIASFNDPALTKLVEESQTNNKDLAASAAGVMRAQAIARQAGAALTPIVGLSGGTSRAGSLENGTPETSGLSVGLQVSWEADVWGRIRAGVRSAQAAAQAVEADYRYSQHSLAATTAHAYFTVIEANLQKGIARETVEILEETIRIVGIQHKNGLVSSQDVALMRSDLASARERLTATEGSYRDVVRALELILGRYPSAELATRRSLPGVPPQPPTGLPSELLERRPDIIAAERRVAAAFNTVTQAKAAQLPSLSLTGDIGGASGSLSNLLDPTNIAWRIGANLLAPVFDGGTRKEQVNIATAEQAQALAAYGQAALNAFGEIENSLDQGLVLAQREVDLKVAAREADNAYRVANLRYKEGETDLLDLLTIQQRGIQAKSNLVYVQRLLLDQRVYLHLALGGSWAPLNSKAATP